MINLLKNNIESNELNNELIDFLFNSVQSKTRHSFYERVCKVYDKAFAYATGDGIDKYMRQFHRREDNEMFKQRLDLTSNILQMVVSTLDFLLIKASRSSAIHCDYVNTNRQKEIDLIETDNNFHANKSIYDYFKKYQRHYDRTDPNAWLIVEFESTDGKELAEPYPFHVSSKQAVDFEYINGLLNYLLIEVESKEYKGYNDYTLYTPNQNIKLKAEKNEEILNSLVNDLDVRDINGVIYVRLDKRLYSLIVPNAHNIGWVQARRYGYNLDSVTNCSTFVPFWWSAEPILTKIINVNSELDLSLALHNFPQKLVYTMRCSAEGCNCGRLPDNTVCKSCNGTGRQKVHTTGQDVIELALPDSKEEMIDLNSLIAYIYPPIDGMRFTDEKLTALIKMCKEAVYNSDTYTRNEISDTATGLNIGMESIYDTIYPYAVNLAESWEFVVNTSAKIIDAYEELIVTATVDKDFKFKTKSELLKELNDAKLAGANESIIRAIQHDIMIAIFDEKPSELIKYNIKDKFFPFSGKTEAEIIGLMAGPYIPNEVKVLYSNFGNIFDELERENENFYELNSLKQKELIGAKVTEISLRLKEQNVNILNLDTEEEQEVE